jgi:hypothetical protein
MIDEAVENAAKAKSHLAEIEKCLEDIEVIKAAVLDAVKGQITDEEIQQRLDQINSGNSDDDEEEEEEDVDMRYVADSSKIVAVTYGTGKTAYKTFLLNYNSYDIIVEYNGHVYTIDSGEFVVITYNN